jgi:WD40 repeat protein
MWHLNRARHTVSSRAASLGFLLVFALLAAMAPLIRTGQAQVRAAPSEPILRIEAGQHVAIIRRIATDAAERFAVTASEDKTVRVWSLPDGRLLRILRLPIDADDENVGKAYAVALAPDGSTVAVGGWLAKDPYHNYILLFDRASGELKQRFGDLPSVVSHLAYSPDGRRLAASLLGSNGVRVFDAQNGYQLLPSDTQYKGHSLWASFDRAGRLVTTSYDGFVRLYAADNYAAPIARFDSNGHRPFSAAFSPDGSRVAVGYDDFNEVAVLSGSDLKTLFKADTTGVPNGASMYGVGWSRDGRFLFAGGVWEVHNMRKVRRWSEAGRGASIDIPAGTDTIMQLLGLKDGSMLIAHTQGFGLISPDAKATQLQGRGNLDLRSGKGPLQVSTEGSAVQVDSWEPNHTYRFALTRRVIDIDPPADVALKAPITDAAGLAVANWRNSRTPTVNGKPIKLKDFSFESARSIAIVPRTQPFVLGADYSVRLIDKEANEIWSKPVPDVAWQVNVSGDGRFAIVAYGDGTIRWHRLSDGKELLALFMHPDGQRWILWTPQGYYDAALGADELIGWQVNNGDDRAPDFYPASRFRDRFYRPDVIRRVLQTRNLDVEEAVRDADKEAGRTNTRAAPAVSSLLTPTVEINDPKNPARMIRTDLQLGYSVRLPSPDDSLRVEALVDGVKVPSEDSPLVSSGGLRAGILHLTIPRRNSKVSVIAYNQNGAGEPASVQVEWAGPGTDPKLTLYVLAIGISDYKDKKVQLRFASKDAGDFEALTKSQAGGLYEKVIAHSLRDDQATREAVLDELDWIKKVEFQ